MDASSPSPEQREVAGVLLRRAESDLRARRRLADETDMEDDVVGFHAQQAVEKAIKAALGRRGPAPCKPGTTRGQRAERLQPYAATPHVRGALEVAGALSSAASAAKAATVDESTNRRTWLVLARIDARRGESTAAVEALCKERLE